MRATFEVKFESTATFCKYCPSPKNAFALTSPYTRTARVFAASGMTYRSVAVFMVYASANSSSFSMYTTPTLFGSGRLYNSPTSNTNASSALFDPNSTSGSEI